MKKPKGRSLLVYVLVLSLLLACLCSVGSVFAAEQAPAIGSYKDFAAENAELAALAEGDGTTKFGISGRQANGPFTFAGMNGNTWYLSTVLNFSTLAGDGTELCFATGDVSTYVGVPLRVRIFNNSSGAGRFWVMYAGGTAMNSTGAATVHSAALEAFATGQDYAVTIQVKNGDKLSIWLDGELVVEDLSLSANGITNVKPATGWRAYIGNGTGCFKNGIQVWDGVTMDQTAPQPPAAVPTIGKHVNFAEETLGGALEFGTTGNRAKGPVYFTDKVQGNTWYVSTVLNYTTLGADGVELCFGTGDVATYTDAPLRVRIFNNSSGAGRFWVMYAGGTEMSASGAKTIHSAALEAFATNQDYTVTIQVKNGDTLSIWLDGVLVVENLSLGANGITDVKPATGWRCYDSVGSFRDFQVWDDVAVKADVAPTIGKYENFAAAQLGGEVEFGTTGNRARGPILFTDKVQGNTWYLSTVLKYTDLGADGTELCFGIGNVSTYTDAPVRVRIFNNSSGAGRFWVMYAGGTEMSASGAATIHSVALDAFAENTEYAIAIQVENSDTVSIWLNDVRVVEDLSLSANGITHVKPATGWRCYDSVGTFRNFQVWDGVTEQQQTPPTPPTPPSPPEKAPQIGEYINFAETQSTLVGTQKFGAGSQQTGPVLFGDAAKGDTWYLSTTLNFATLGGEGGELCFAVADKGSLAGVPLRVRLWNTGSGNGYCHVMLARGPEMSQVGDAVFNVPIGKSLAAETDYQVVIQVEKGDQLSLWIDDEKIIDGKSLSALGLTALKPAAGWRIYGSTGTLRNIQVWDGITLKPEFDPQKETNHAPSGSVQVKDIELVPLEQIEFGSSFHFSGRVLLEESSTAAGQTVGLQLGTGRYQNTDVQVIARYLPDRNVGQLVLCSSQGDTVLVEQPFEADSIKDKASFLYTVTYNNDTVSFWVDDMRVANKVDLRKTHGIREIKISLGFIAISGDATVSDICVWGSARSTAGIFFKKFDDITSYRQADAFTAPVHQGYLFAGWFADEAGKEPLKTSVVEGSAYAKFVPEGVLKVLVSISKDTTGESQSTNMRLLTTVDSRIYRAVSFDVTCLGITHKFEDIYVKTAIMPQEDESEFAFAPTYIHRESGYFYTFRILNIQNDAFGQTIQIIPRWTTMDGTQVQGKSMDITIDSLL